MISYTKPILVYLIAIIALAFSSCILNKNKSKEHLSAAQRYCEQNDFNNALKELDKSILLDSSNYEAFILKGKVKSKLDLDEEALQVLLYLLNKSYKVDTVNFLLGEASFALGNFFIMKKNDDSQSSRYFNESINYYNAALLSNSYYFKAYIAKSHAQHNLAQYDEALITINSALNLFPDSMILVYSGGVEKSFLGDNLGAIKDLDIAISSNKLDSTNMSSAYRFRGNINLELKELDIALDDLNNALLFDPKDEIAYFLRAKIYRAKGLKDKACEDYRKSAELGLFTVYETIKEYCNQ